MTAKRRASRRRPIGEDAKRRDRAVKALGLRIDGRTYREIGQQLLVSEKTAYLDVQTELGRLDTIAKTKAERLRELEARRLDVLTVALTAGIREGEPRAIGAAVRVMERRAKLFGLDAPTTVTTPDGEALPIRVVHEYLGPLPPGHEPETQ